MGSILIPALVTAAMKAELTRSGVAVPSLMLEQHSWRRTTPGFHALSNGQTELSRLRNRRDQAEACPVVVDHQRHPEVLTVHHGPIGISRTSILPSPGAHVSVHLMPALRFGRSAPRAVGIALHAAARFLRTCSQRGRFERAFGHDWRPSQQHAVEFRHGMPICEIGRGHGHHPRLLELSDRLLPRCCDRSAQSG